MSQTYPYIRANGRLMGSNEPYIADEIAKAARDKAPADAWSWSTDKGRWNTLADLDASAAAGNPMARSTAERLRKHAN